MVRRVGPRLGGCGSLGPMSVWVPISFKVGVYVEMFGLLEVYIAKFS